MIIRPCNIQEEIVISFPLSDRRGEEGVRSGEGNKTKFIKA
jgi:hypothetical protein